VARLTTPKQKRLQEPSSAANRDAEATRQQTRQLFDNVPFLDGNAVIDITIPAAVLTNVEHGLERVPQGYIVTKATLADTVPRFVSADDRLAVMFITGATDWNGDLWFF